MTTNKLTTCDRPRLQLILMFSMIGVLACGSTALAGTLTGVGQDPAPPMGPFEGDDNNDDMIMVGTESQPVPIVPDPNGPPWMKEFVINRDGQGWSETGPGSMVTVMEFITFPPPDPTGGSGTVPPKIIDWHEDIVPDVGDGANFKWAGGVIELFGSGAPPIPGMVSSDGKSIWFDFPPFPPGLPIKITKQLMWTGGVVTGSDPNNLYRIKVNERPSVPEPAAMALAGLALIGVSGFVRRNRRM